MTETILSLLTRLSEAGDDTILPGDLAERFRGPVFDRFLAKRILVEQAPLADWEVCDACECGLPCRPIRMSGDEFRAECPLDRRRDVVLGENDLRAFRVGASELAAALASAAGFEQSPMPVTKKIWRIGNMASGRIVFLTLEGSALAFDGIAASLRQSAQGAEISVLAPRLPTEDDRRLRDAGFHLVETVAVLTRASNGLGAEINVAALVPASLANTLRVRTNAAEVLWNGRAVTMSHQLFPVFLRLVEKARSRDPVVSRQDVEDTTGREAKDLIRELRSALKTAGFTDAETKALIVTVRSRGYRLGVPANEIVVEH